MALREGRLHQRHQLVLQRLQIAGRLLVEDEQVHREVVEAEELVGDQHLAAQIGDPAVVHAENDERQITGDAAGPERSPPVPAELPGRVQRPCAQ